MNIQVKQNVYYLKIWNVLMPELDLSGHYTLILDKRQTQPVLYITKHGDYCNLVSYTEETNPLRKATQEEFDFFMPKAERRLATNIYCGNLPTDFENTFESLREIYKDHEALIDLVLTKTKINPLTPL